VILVLAVAIGVVPLLAILWPRLQPEAGYKLSEREIQRRLQAARTYLTEAQIRQVLTDLETVTSQSRPG
jgi:hypothetical protein